MPVLYGSDRQINNAIHSLSVCLAKGARIVFRHRYRTRHHACQCCNASRHPSHAAPWVSCCAHPSRLCSFGQYAIWSISRSISPARLGLSSIRCVDRSVRCPAVGIVRTGANVSYWQILLKNSFSGVPKNISSSIERLE